MARGSASWFSLALFFTVMPSRFTRALDAIVLMAVKRLGVGLDEFGEAQHRVGDGRDYRERFVRVTVRRFVTAYRSP